MKSILWTSQDAASATDGQTGRWQAYGLSIDTRTLQPGDLFIALKGPNSDGHDYALAALEKGATAVMVDHIPEGCAEDQCLLVADTMQALADLGQAARARTSAKIIAVTGSVGKTGTKDMLEQVFSAQCRTHASQKSFNNHWGVPLTLALMPVDTEVGVFEVGMNHADEITPLSQMIRPDIAIITTVEAVHIENFKNGEEGVAAAKAEIFDGLQENGAALLNQSNKWFSFLEEKANNKGANTYGFGDEVSAKTYLSDVTITAEETKYKAVVRGKTLDISLPVSGLHHAMNSLPVLLSAALLGYDLDRATSSLATWQQRDGRGKQERIIIKDGAPPIILIDEHYNASPVAMRAAFAALGRADLPAGGRRVAVLGDMAELGADAAAYHKALANDLLQSDVDLVYAAGENMKYLYDALPRDKQGHYANLPIDLCAPLQQNSKAGDVILVKGSRGGAEKPKMLCLVDAVKSLSQH